MLWVKLIKLDHFEVNKSRTSAESLNNPAIILLFDNGNFRPSTEGGQY